MKYDKHEMCQTAMMLANKKLKVVKLYGVRDDGTCTCPKGKDCGDSAGKHPVGNGWQHFATDNEEEIAGWFDDLNENVRWNIGVRLGKLSGVIDVEADDEDSVEVMKRYGLDRVDTVAYMGSRGPHYLFRYEEDLPDAGVVKVDGLEARLGGGFKASQSVFPKSWHRTGKQYEWLPGRSIEEVDIAPLPPEFKQAILDNSKVHGSGVMQQSMTALATRQRIKAGQRHGYLLGVASKLCSQCRQYTDDDKDIILALMLALNKDLPEPKGEQEVIRIVEDQFDHYRQRRDNIRRRDVIGMSGLEYNPATREYDPGEWKLTCVDADPPYYRLWIPGTARNNPDNTKPIVTILSVKEFRAAHLVAEKVQESSLCLNLGQPTPSTWAKIWIGETIEEDDGHRRHKEGLMNKLMAVQTIENPPPEDKEYCYAAGVLSEYLSRFGAENHQEENPKPHEDGTPRWIGDRLYFKWWAGWNGALRKGDTIAKKVKQDVGRRVLKAVGKKEWDSEHGKRFGLKGRWIIWGTPELDALAAISREG